MEVSGNLYPPCCFTPSKELQYPSNKGLSEPGAGLDVVEKSKKLACTGICTLDRSAPSLVTTPTMILHLCVWSIINGDFFTYIAFTSWSL